MNQQLKYQHNYTIGSQILFVTIVVLILMGINILIDLSHITVNRVEEGYRYEYGLSLILLNIIYLWVFFNLKYSINDLYVWITFILFCVYTYWSQDYFHMGKSFYHGVAVERDLLYEYLMPISFEKYSILRLIIWGTALYLVFRTFEKFKINLSISSYVFALFYLVFFSFPRASLGLAFYYYALTYIICPTNVLKIKKWFIIAICFFLSFCAHRSMLILIILTPLIYIKFNKLRLLLLLISFPFLILFLQNFLTLFLLQESSSSFIESAQTYTEMQSSFLETRNWKFQLIESLKIIGFYIPTIYLIYLFCQKKSQSLPREIHLMVRMIFLVIIVATLFFLLIENGGVGLYIIGYRVLLMAGIPLCIVLSYCYQKKLISLIKLNFLILLGFLYGELYIVGKIFFSNLKG